jgi:mitochondrial fission protein ELM1
MLRDQVMVGREKLVWVILGDKRGDNGQVYTILSELGWPYQLKTLHMQEQFVLGKPEFKPSLDHLDMDRSDRLEAPWPDLIITIGRRPSMVALWVKQQSGGRTRIVLVGKPTGAMGAYDLVISSAENQLPPFSNLMSISLPLMQVDKNELRLEGEAWHERLNSLPKPLTVFCIGGETNPFVMDQVAAGRLLDLVQSVLDQGGTPYLVTSRRTPPEFVSRLQSVIPAGAFLYDWQSEDPNPYKGLLDQASSFVVTGDSISMMVEVIRLEKALAIFPLPTAWWGGLDQQRRQFARWLFNPVADGVRGKARHHMARFLSRLDRYNWFSATRDFRAFHEMLVNQGMAVWAGQPFSQSSRQPVDEMPMIVQRIRDLVGS